MSKLSYNFSNSSSLNEKLKWIPEINCFLRPYFLANPFLYSIDSSANSLPLYFAIGISLESGSMQGNDWNHRNSSSSKELLTKSDINEKNENASSIVSNAGVMISIWLSEKSVVM